MAKEVVLSELASEDYEQIVDYLVSDWSIEIAIDFIDRLNKVRVILAERPELYPFENKIKSVRRCVVTKHNVLYFKETET